MDQQVENELAKNEVQLGRKKSGTFKPQFKWDIKSFDEEEALKNLSRLGNENLQTENTKIHDKLHVDQWSIKNNLLKKEHVYLLRGESQQGKIQLNRRYSDFYFFREALVRRWPGILIPPIPEKGNIGTTQKQITKNKFLTVCNFINRILENEAIAKSEELNIFITSAETEVQRNLQKLKPHTLEDLYGIYKQEFPNDFDKISEEKQKESEQKIKDFQNYFSQIKKDLTNHKNQVKKLAELRTKLTTQRYLVLQKSLPQYETTCFSWFNNKHNIKKPSKEEKKEKVEKEDKENKEDKDDKEDKEDKEKEENNQQNEQKNQQKQRGYKGIYSSTKYQSALQAYKNELFPKQQGQNQNWLIYQLFKYQLRQIESMLQAINRYKYLNTQKQFFQRNIQLNKQQLEDIANNKFSLKILLLSGSEQQKKNQLSQETQLLQTKYKIAEQLWIAMTQHAISEIQKFQMERCEVYKKSLAKIFKKEAIYMAKLFALSVEIRKI